MHPRAHALHPRAGLPHWPSSSTGHPSCAHVHRAHALAHPRALLPHMDKSWPLRCNQARGSPPRTRVNAPRSRSGHPHRAIPEPGTPQTHVPPELMHCARALAIPLRPSSSTVTRAGSPAEPSQSTCANAHRPSDVAGLSATTLQFRLSQRPAPSHRATSPQSDHGLQTFTRSRTDDTLTAPSALGDRCFHSPTTPHTCPPTRCWHSPLPHLPKRAFKYPAIALGTRCSDHSSVCPPTSLGLLAPAATAAPSRMTNENRYD